MVIVQHSKKTKALVALLTVLAYAVLISQCTSAVLDWMATKALPDAMFWLVAGILSLTGPSTYSMLLGPTDDEVLRGVVNWD